MAKYAAVCNRFPELQIGNYLKFSEGSFETDDEEIWGQLQKSDWWGVFIHPRDTPAADAGAPAAEPATEPAAVTEPLSEEQPESHSRAHRGTRGTR